MCINKFLISGQKGVLFKPDTCPQEIKLIKQILEIPQGKRVQNMFMNFAQKWIAVLINLKNHW